MKKTLYLIFLLFIVGCSNKYNSGIKLLNEKQYREAINVLKEVEPKNNNYSEAQINISYAEYMLSVDLIKENKLDSAIIELSKINKNSLNFNKSQSALNYCKALKSIEKNNQKEALAFLKDVQADCEFYLNAQEKFKEIDTKIKKSITFQDFANSFIKEAFISPEKLASFSEDIILTSSILGDFKTTPLKEFENLKKERKVYKKQKIKKISDLFI